MKTAEIDATFGHDNSIVKLKILNLYTYSFVAQIKESQYGTKHYQIVRRFEVTLI